MQLPCKHCYRKGGPRIATVVEDQDGSTTRTCRESIDEHLQDKQNAENARARASGAAPNPLHPFGREDQELPLQQAVSLLTRVIWDSIGEVVVSARHGMAFIQTIAKIVAKENKPLVWTAPTGFVVEQAYYQERGIHVDTQMLGRLSIRIYEETEAIDPIRMGNSAAPNFVHSMDAAHLVKSVNGFVDAGLESIAVIHDSFGTHAGDTDILRDVLRREFVELYSHDWLEEFKLEVEAMILKEIEEEVPRVGTLDIKEVLSSTYCFS